MMLKFIVLPTIAAVLLASCAMSAAQTAQTDASRYERGRAKMAELDPKLPDALKRNWQDLAPDIERYAAEFVFGDIYSRPGLPLRTRQMLTVGMLAAMGNARPQLKLHIGLALNIGITPEELREVLIQTVAYAGFPTSLNGLSVLREVMEERGLLKKP
jgi:4-carboxymuconolactone decarboxylase